MQTASHGGTDMSNWIYNELRHCGVDYADDSRAATYDLSHRKFRNYEKEFQGMMYFLSAGNTHDMTVVDLGCGTGAVSLHAAKYFKRVYAVDVSEAMIQQASEKAVKEKISNIEFIRSGFLSYEHATGAADLVITKAALHHLPDFWKQVALLRINRMLKPSGVLYIFDVVFHFHPVEYITRINDWINGYEAVAGKEFKAEVQTHIRDEFSTFGWIMEGMLARAGFTVEKSRTGDGFISEYLCRKTEDVVIVKND